MHAFLHLLLILSEFLLLTIVQDRLDLGARVFANALHLGHLVFPGQGTVLTQRHHLLLLVGKDRLDLRLLVGGQVVALGHARNLFIGSHLLMAHATGTIPRLLGGSIGGGVILLRKGGSRAKGEPSG